MPFSRRLSINGSSTRDDKLTPPVATPPKHKRRKIFVDADVQSELLRQLVYHWLMFLTTLLWILVIVEFVKSGFTARIGECMSNVMHDNVVMLMSLLVLAPMAIYQMVKVSHRFVGPMVKFRRSIARLGAGEQVEPVCFRKNDFWKDIAANFNLVVGRIEELEAAAKKPSPTQNPELVEVG